MQIIKCQAEGCRESTFYSDGQPGYSGVTPIAKGWQLLGGTLQLGSWLCPSHKTKGITFDELPEIVIDLEE